MTTNRNPDGPWLCRYCTQLNAEYSKECGRCEKPRVAPLPRVITIVIRDSNFFDIHEGESLTNQLTWDEFLGSIAVITHPSLSKLTPIPPYSRLQHIDDFLASRMRYWSRSKPASAEPETEAPASDGLTENDMPF